MDLTEMLGPLSGYYEQGRDIAIEWATSPAAWSQFGLLIVSFLLAIVVSRKLSKILERVITPDPESTNMFAPLRRFALTFLPLLLPLIAYAFTAIGEGIVRSLFESGAVIAFGKRVFLFLAARRLVEHVITSPFPKFLGKFILVPIAGLYALGLLETTSEALTNLRVGIGNISFSAMAIVRGVIAGSILFWLGKWSNDQSNSFIGRQETMPPATRQLAGKAAEIGIFGVAFLLLMNIVGINLSSLAVLGGAIGVGLGFGLQKIASNFISGVILLVEGQATVGDYVELDGGEAGTIIKMTARATFLETFDGRWIVVPNEDFITTRVVNYSDSGSANRLEADFSVSYDTDINIIPDLIQKAVLKHPGVLSEPELPDVELRGFGDNGIDFAVEFWVEGIDDGKNKFTSDVLFLIWNALKENDITIPYPQRVVEIKGNLPQDATA